jgi:hypothetical protein
LKLSGLAIETLFADCEVPILDNSWIGGFYLEELPLSLSHRSAVPFQSPGIRP